MKKSSLILPLIMLPLSITSLASCTIRIIDKNYDMDMKSVTLHNGYNKSKNNYNVHFEKGYPEIGYLSAQTFIDINKEIDSREITLKKDTNKKTITFIRNSTEAIFDFKNNTVLITLLSSFDASNNLTSSTDTLTYPSDSVTNAIKENKIMGKALELSKFDLGKGRTFIDLNEYNIDLIWSNGVGYIPLQLLSDLFLVRRCTPLLYNGETMMFLPEFAFKDETEYMKELWYKKEKKTRSKAYSEFTYNSLCLNLDYNYGLKNIHSIDSFDEYFKQNKLHHALLDNDPEVASKALADFISIYIDDLHTTFKSGASFASAIDIKSTYQGPSLAAIKNNIELYSDQYELFTEQDSETPSYIEEGDTAFIYFQTFNADETKNYYDPSLKTPENEKWWVENNDLFGLVQYAHRKIAREESPVKKVVVDLSTNTGGAIDTAAYLAQWLIGKVNNPVFIHTNDNITGASASIASMIDTNLDHVFDDKDLLSSYGVNVYCLTSPVSFSCGNFVPSILKNSGKAVLIGQKTSGGTCAVFPTTTADGCMFDISGATQLSSYKNGTYYSIDEGIEPDIYLSDMSTLYNSKEDGGSNTYRGELIDLIKTIK